MVTLAAPWSFVLLVLRCQVDSPTHKVEHPGDAMSQSPKVLDEEECCTDDGGRRQELKEPDKME
jgi:hypothetical protein